MSGRLHDTYARVTPFEIAFPDAAVVAALSANVADEVGTRGTDDTELEAFMTSAAVVGLVRELGGPDAPPESSYPFAALLFHSVHFHRAGRPVVLVDTDLTRLLTSAGFENAPEERTEIEPLGPAGYLQLPQHLLWTESSEIGAGGAGGASNAAPPESLDGTFWTVSGAGMLHALAISGLRPDRAGFGAHPLPGAPLADAPLWLDARVRESGEDFASGLPGAELDQLRSVEAAGEILKLLARFFVTVSEGRVGLDARPAASAHPAPDTGRGDPRPSGLPYTRVSLGG